MSFFTPVLFSIATLAFSEETLDAIRSSLEEASISSSSGFAFDFDAIAFANKHPEAHQVLLEVQALTEEDRTKAIDLVTASVATATKEEVFWNDVTKAALAYHSELKSKTPATAT